MKRHQVEEAERRALTQLDKWNDVTGFLDLAGSYKVEIEYILKEAVHIGIQMALNNKVEYDEEGNVDCK